MNETLLDRINALEEDNAALRKQCSEMCDLLRVGIRTPNTDMIIGAVLSGGDVMGLAKKLANGGGSLL